MLQGENSTHPQRARDLEKSSDDSGNRRTKRDANGGFTLIELMIVASIIAILAAVAYPAYQDQILKSRRAEGKAKLYEMAQALEKCRSLYGSYNHANCAARNALIADGAHPISENGYFRVSASGGAVTDFGFSLQAEPIGYRDADCGSLTLDQTGARGKSGAGALEDCW